MTAKQTVVVTGIGVLTSIGSTRETFWTALTNGVSGVAPIAALDASPYETRIASELCAFDPLAYMPRQLAGRMARNSQLAVCAAMDAVKDAGLDLNVRRRIASDAASVPRRGTTPSSRRSTKAFWSVGRRP